MTEHARTARGILFSLEVHRLANHGQQVLSNTGELLDELLGYRILPEILADRLTVFRDDVRVAIEQKNRA